MNYLLHTSSSPDVLSIQMSRSAISIHYTSPPTTQDVVKTIFWWTHWNIGFSSVSIFMTILHPKHQGVLLNCGFTIDLPAKIRFLLNNTMIDIIERSIWTFRELWSPKQIPVIPFSCVRGGYTQGVRGIQHPPLTPHLCSKKQHFHNDSVLSCHEP